jgi:hypothetical protein
LADRRTTGTRTARARPGNLRSATGASTTGTRTALAGPRKLGGPTGASTADRRAATDRNGPGLARNLGGPTGASAALARPGNLGSATGARFDGGRASHRHGPGLAGNLVRAPGLTPHGVGGLLERLARATDRENAQQSGESFGHGSYNGHVSRFCTPRAVVVSLICACAVAVCWVLVVEMIA